MAHVTLLLKKVPYLKYLGAFTYPCTCISSQVSNQAKLSSFINIRSPTDEFPPAWQLATTYGVHLAT